MPLFKSRRSPAPVHQKKKGVLRRIALWGAFGSAATIGGYKAVEHWTAPQPEKRIERKIENANESVPLPSFSKMLMEEKKSAISELKAFGMREYREYLARKAAFEGMKYDVHEKMLEDRIASARKVAERVAKEQKLPVELLKAICQKESFFDPHAVGGVGELGIAQLKAETLYDLHARLHYTITNPFDAYQNLTGAAILWNDRVRPLRFLTVEVPAKKGYNGPKKFRQLPRFYWKEGKRLQFSELPERDRFLLMAQAYNQGPYEFLNLKSVVADKDGRKAFDVARILNLNVAYPRQLLDIFQKFGGAFAEG